MKEIEIEGEKVYLKKSISGWRTIKPYKVDGKINWKNFLIGGSWFNLIKVAIFIGILLFLVWSYIRDVSVCRNLLECGAVCKDNIDISNITFSLP